MVVGPEKRSGRRRGSGDFALTYVLCLAAVAAAVALIWESFEATAAGHRRRLHLLRLRPEPGGRARLRLQRRRRSRRRLHVAALDADLRAGLSHHLEAARAPARAEHRPGRAQRQRRRPDRTRAGPDGSMADLDRRGLRPRPAVRVQLPDVEHRHADGQRALEHAADAPDRADLPWRPAVPATVGRRGAAHGAAGADAARGGRMGAAVHRHSHVPRRAADDRAGRAACGGAAVRRCSR